MFLYDLGKDHEYFQDNDFVPDFTAPDGNLPTYLDSQAVVDTCDGNKYCIYDIQSTGLLQLGKATKKAYDDYKQAQRALRDREYILRKTHHDRKDVEIVNQGEPRINQSQYQLTCQLTIERCERYKIISRNSSVKYTGQQLGYTN